MDQQPKSDLQNSFLPTEQQARPASINDDRTTVSYDPSRLITGVIPSPVESVAYDDLEPRFKPVETEVGLEALGYARQNIESFKHFASRLPVGPNTRNALDTFIDSILERPDSIMLFGDNDVGIGRFVHEGLFHGFDVNADLTIEPDKFVVELTPSEINVGITNEILQVAQAIGVEIDVAMAKYLAYSHLIGHELAHCIQTAYSYVMPSTPNDLFPTPHYVHLEDESIKQGISKPIAVPAIPRFSARIESERFAEGVGQDFVVNEMIRLGVISIDDEERITKTRETLVKQRQHDRYQIVVRLISDVPEGDYDQLYRRLNENKVTVNHVGYGMPYDTSQVNKILALTP